MLAKTFFVPIALLFVLPSTATPGFAAPDLSLKTAAVTPADPAWRQNLPHDPEAATEAYLARLPRAAKERSNQYFEGGYWLQLWDFLLAIVIALAILETGTSARVRDWTEKKTRSSIFRIALYIVLYTVLVAALSFPLNVYENFFREHRYGLLNQNFPGWFKEQGISLAVQVVINTLLLGCIYGVVRRLKKSWQIWGAIITTAFLVLILAIGPVFISPLFNRYQPLAESPIKSAILSLARANGIPATDGIRV